MPPRASLREARLKVSPAFSKAAGCRGGVPARAPLKRGTPLCSHKRRRGSKGEPSPGVPPSFFWLVRVRRYFGRWSLAPAALRPHFFGACPKKRCRAAKEKRLFYPGGSTIRVSATSRWSGRSSPDFCRGLVLVGGLCVCAVFLGRSLFPLLPIPPHFFALAQRNGVEPQRNALMGAATGAVRSHPPLPRARSPNITADCVKLTLPGQFTHRA